VRVITFGPHTAQIFQVLDLRLSGVLKRRPRRELSFEDDNATIKFIIKVYLDFRQTMVPPNVWGAFQALGLDSDTRNERYWLLFNEKKPRESACFRERWSIDFPWTGYRASDVLLGSVGPTSWKK
jgi:hypothetical protein